MGTLPRTGAEIPRAAGETLVTETAPFAWVVVLVWRAGLAVQRLPGEGMGFAVVLGGTRSIVVGFGVLIYSAGFVDHASVAVHCCADSRVVHCRCPVYPEI